MGLIVAPIPGNSLDRTAHLIEEVGNVPEIVHSDLPHVVVIGGGGTGGAATGLSYSPLDVSCALTELEWLGPEVVAIGMGWTSGP